MHDLPLPADRPVGLVRAPSPIDRDWWRIDSSEPGGWQWDGFVEPLHRFDPASGAFRTRYAARTPIGALRERYRDSGGDVPADHAHHHLVHLQPTASFRVLDLRSQSNLDALGADDGVNTSREQGVWQFCHAVADAVAAWWGDGGVDGIRYRSRTTPQTSVNLAFFESTPLAVSSTPLIDEADLLDELIIGHGFTIGFLP